MKKIFITAALFIASFQAFDKLQAQQLDISVSIRTAPPLIPVYEQPPCPVDGYFWIPGYWAWGPDGYYWVPGLWIAPPEFGYLWTPGYWAFTGSYYAWHPGYWGLHVGYYGGINYGFGYIGTGFVGGRWEGRRYRYNTAVVNVNPTVVHNTYVDRTVINNVTVVNRTSFNGPGGVSTRPTSQQTAYLHQHRLQATSAQLTTQRNASTDRNQFASVNSGVPHTVAMNRVNGEKYNGHEHVNPRTAPDAISPTEHNAPKPNDRPNHPVTPASRPVNHSQPNRDDHRNPITPVPPHNQPQPDRHPQNKPEHINPAPSHPQPAQQPHMQTHPQPSGPRPAAAPQNHPQPHQPPPHPEHEKK